MLNRARHELGSINMLTFIGMIDDPDLKPGERRTVKAIADSLNDIEDKLIKLTTPAAKIHATGRRPSGKPRITGGGQL